MGYKLLLADDSITIQKVVELILSEEDFSITSVNNGEEALETAKKDKPDIILADILMPKIDGYQLCQQVKKDPDLKTVPILLLAGAYESFDTSKASAIGADDYIIKPFESQELIKKVKDCIERGAKPISEKGSAVPQEMLIPEEVVMPQETVVSQEEDLWASLDLTGKAEVTNAEILGGVGGAEETMGELLDRELEKKAISPEQVGEITAEEKAEDVVLAVPEEEDFSFEAVVQEEVPKATAVSPEKKGEIKIEPLSSDMLKEEIRKTIEKLLSESFSSITPDMIKTELGKKAEDLLRNNLPEILENTTQEIGKIVKETLSPTLDETVKDMVEKISWEVIPDVVERVTKEIIKNSISSGLKETIEKVAWEAVPDMAEILITKEIERLKATE